MSAVEAAPADSPPKFVVSVLVDDIVGELVAHIEPCCDIDALREDALGLEVAVDAYSSLDVADSDAALVAVNAAVYESIDV